MLYSVKTILCTRLYKYLNKLINNFQILYRKSFAIIVTGFEIKLLQLSATNECYKHKELVVFTAVIMYDK